MINPRKEDCMNNFKVTKDDIMKVMKLKGNGNFYAKSPKRSVYDGNVIYNDVSVHRNYRGRLSISCHACRCQDDRVVDEQTFELFPGEGWKEYYESLDRYSPIYTKDKIDNREYIIASVRNCSDEYDEYVRHLMKLFIE